MRTAIGYRLALLGVSCRAHAAPLLLAVGGGGDMQGLRRRLQGVGRYRAGVPGEALEEPHRGGHAMPSGSLLGGERPSIHMHRYHIDKRDAIDPGAYIYSIIQYIRCGAHAIRCHRVQRREGDLAVHSRQ